MKKVIVSTLFLLSIGFFSGVAGAGYFKAIDAAHPQTSMGAFSDLKGHADAGGSLALITHSTKDGCIIPGVCLDWTPLAIGGTLGKNLGGASIALGTSANLLPAVEQGLLAIIKGVFPSDDSAVVLKKMLLPSVSGNPDIAVAIGPQWSYVLNNGIKGKGIVTLFYGAAWKF